MSLRESARSRRRRTALESGPFVLQTLLESVPLSAEGDSRDIEIKCVEFHDQNLYIGTSASEVLHFVQIPPEPTDPFGKPSYILASRLQLLLLPIYADNIEPEKPGVQQILLLPKANKVCILCNRIATFYSLPELSPVFSNIKVQKCTWVGGVDLNLPKSDNVLESATNSMTVLISNFEKILVVRVGEQARSLKTIKFAGSTISLRRDSFACVADSRSYALLDVNRELKIPLFPISSLDESQAGAIGGQAQDISSHTTSGNQRSLSSIQGTNSTISSNDHGHSRSTSLSAFMSGPSRRQGQRDGSTDRSGRDTSDNLLRETSPAPPLVTSRRMSVQREVSPTKKSGLSEKPLPTPPELQAADQPLAPPTTPPIYLKPHITSPSPQEFLLVTGTRPSDPGVGIFINLDGDVTRSTLEFDHYPDELVTDGRGVGIDLSQHNVEDEEEGYVLATMCRNINQRSEYGLEIQRWDLDPGEGESQKFWLRVPNSTESVDSVKREVPKPGIRTLVDAGEIMFEDVVERLRLKRFRPFVTKSIDTSTLSLQSADSRTATSLERVSKERELFESQDMHGDESLPDGWEENRNNEEWQFAGRLSRTRSRIAVWSGDKIWWAVRNPLILRLDASLESAVVESGEAFMHADLDRRKIIEVIKSLRGREAKTEIEYLSLGYIRQRAGLLLLISLIRSPSDASDIEYSIIEEALLDGGLDPRVPLALVPLLRNEIIESRTGIWIHGGVKYVAQDYISDIETPVMRHNDEFCVSENILQLYRRFLTTWRRKKGFESIADKSEVFRSIDAALLVVLLQLDRISSKGPTNAKIRSELNVLVDHGMDCFERATYILEAYHRLYILSRLYQSRKMAKEVLSTWRRIIEGELDEGGEFSDGEQKISEYLKIVRNPTLVQKYGVWLAARNPHLGVQVFAEEQSKVRFEPTQVVEILRHGAPDAVKDYLEYLVFGKNHTEYVNELIAYYLDIVIHKLESSEEARWFLSQTYESYRALRPPKPTYRQFITDNAIQDEWWHSRLRLLQLLGGSHETVSEYDVATILARIEPFTQELVPEVIILDGRQSHHKDALKLLTHSLGDFDTAINYCLLGGSSIYHPISGSKASENLPSREEQSKLFESLLAEFLCIEDISNRVEQTGSLLERFGSWFDVEYTLRLIPDSWSVELVSGFLVSAFRRIVRERSQTMIAKALSVSESLKTDAHLIGKIEEIGPSIEA